MAVKRKALLIAALVGGVFAVAACRHGRGKSKAPPAPVVVEKVAIDPGDELEIRVFGEKDLSGTFQVSGEGTIDYFFAGRVKVAGLTPPQVAALLTRKLANGYIKNPQVSVLAKNYGDKKKVYVWGQVQKSGTFNLRTNMSLIEALTQAGGLTPMADKNGITLTRVEAGQRRKLAVPMGEGQSANFRLQPGDVIFVPERIF